MENIEASIRGKHILIVEDIIDTGRTMKKLLNTLAKLEPKCQCYKNIFYWSSRKIS
jgi:hypoxanthine phosphoribosyltransferase